MSYAGGEMSGGGMSGREGCSITGMASQYVLTGSQVAGGN
jgi:hypothetical protein